LPITAVTAHTDYNQDKLHAFTCSIGFCSVATMSSGFTTKLVHCTTLSHTGNPWQSRYVPSPLSPRVKFLLRDIVEGVRIHLQLSIGLTYIKQGTYIHA